MASKKGAPWETKKKPALRTKAFHGPDGRVFKGCPRRYEAMYKNYGASIEINAINLYPPNVRHHLRGPEMLDALENPNTPTEAWLGLSLNSWREEMRKPGYVLDIQKLAATQQTIVKSIAMAYTGDAAATAKRLYANGLDVDDEFIELMARSKGFGDYLQAWGAYGRVPMSQEALMSMWSDIANDPTAKASDRMKAGECLARAHGMYSMEVRHSGSVGLDVRSVLQDVQNNRAALAHGDAKELEVDAHVEPVDCDVVDVRAAVVNHTDLWGEGPDEEEPEESVFS